VIGTLAGARHWGADGDDTAVTAALNAAAERVKRFCRDEFERVTDTRVLDVVNGFAWAPTRMGLPTAVTTWRGSLGWVAVVASAWTAVPAAAAPPLAGDTYDGLQLVTAGGDGLIAGAEPWNGGWANLYGSVERVRVTGPWGWQTTPANVVLASEMLAGQIGAGPYVPSADAEGNPVGNPAGYVPGTSTASPPEHVMVAGRLEDTTGLAAADRLLVPYRRNPFRLA
jgi:hypothetical protein